MNTNIVWTIEWMQCKPSEGQYTDVVITAGWRCTGNQSVGDTRFSATSCGVASFPLQDGAFTPYADLTQDQVLNWCWSNGVNKTGTESKIEAEIQLQINPPIVTLPLPWAGA
jgi:hypothetical protein